MARSISRQQLEELIAAGNVTVVEALPEASYEEGHLPGAIHLGNDDVAGRAPGWPAAGQERNDRDVLREHRLPELRRVSGRARVIGRGGAGRIMAHPALEAARRAR